MNNKTELEKVKAEIESKKEEKEEIYKYCLEKLNWQITEQMMLSD